MVESNSTHIRKSLLVAGYWGTLLAAVCYALLTLGGRGCTAFSILVFRNVEEVSFSS